MSLEFLEKYQALKDATRERITPIFCVQNCFSTFALEEKKIVQLSFNDNYSGIFLDKSETFKLIEALQKLVKEL